MVVKEFYVHILHFNITSILAQDEVQRSFLTWKRLFIHSLFRLSFLLKIHWILYMHNVSKQVGSAHYREDLSGGKWRKTWSISITKY